MSPNLVLVYQYGCVAAPKTLQNLRWRDVETEISGRERLTQLTEDYALKRLSMVYIHEVLEPMDETFHFFKGHRRDGLLVSLEPPFPEKSLRFWHFVNKQD